MTRCTTLSERMPEVLHGRSDWTAEEARHLRSCADCRAEWEIIATAARLGASLSPSPDPAIAAARVLERIAVERGHDRARARRWLGAGVAAAAAVALAVWTARSDEASSVPPQGALPAVSSPVAAVPGPARRPADSSMAPIRPTSPERWELPMPELDSLSVEELDAMLRGLDEALAQAERGSLVLDEAADAELEAVLAGWEG